MRRISKYDSETNLQIQVADYLRLQYPNVLFHSDYGSGVKLTIRQAVIQKRLNGGKRSWPDMFIARHKMLPVANEYAPNGYDVRCFGGLFLEIKKEGVRLRKKDYSWATPHIKEQAATLEKLRERGYKAEFAVGFEEAKQIIDNYLGGA